MVSSKNFVLKLKGEYSSVDQISLKNERDLLTVLPSGKGLFSKNKLVIIENFPLKKNFVLPKTLDYDVLLWFSETINPPSWIEKTWHFKARENISSFRFADYIFYGQEKQALEVLKRLLMDNKEREMIIGTLVRQVRMISLFLNNEKSEISKSQYVQERVAEQAKNWSTKKVRAALVYLLKTDLWLKQGRLSQETLLTNLTLNLCRLVKT